MKFLTITVGLLLFAYIGFANHTIDSLKQLLKNHSTLDSVRVDLLNQLGYEYWIMDPVQSELYGNEALQLADTLGYKPGEAFAYRVVGVAHWARGHYSTAQEYLFEGLKIYQQLNDTLGIASMFNNLGLVYFDQRSYELGLEYFEEALAKYKEAGREERGLGVLSNLGKAYMRLENYSKADSIFTELLKKHLQQGSRYDIAESYSNLGELHLALQQYDTALKNFQHSFEVRKDIPDLEGMSKCLYFMGKSYLGLKEYAMAEKHLLQGIDTALKVSTRKWLTNIYETLKDLEVARGNYRQALMYFEQFAVKKDSLFDEEKSRQIAEMQTRFETMQKEQLLQMQHIELEMLRQRAKIQSFVRSGLLTGLLVLGIIGYLVISRQRLKILKNKELLAKNREIYHSQQALAQAELENARLQEKKLLQEIEFKNKELTSYTINFIQKNELMEELKTGIEQLKKSQDRETAKKLNGLNRLVENSMHIDRDWEDFKRHFEEVHKDFFKMLKECCPDLTNNELKLCALLRLNMNLKEAANIMGISPESVKTARYRLRKKLNLSREENLIDYIINLEKGMIKQNSSV